MTSHRNPEEHGISNKLAQVTSALFKQFCSTYGSSTCPYYPQANGSVERAVQAVKNPLQKCKESGADPHLAMLCLCSTPLDHNIASPVELLNSRVYKSTSPLDPKLACHYLQMESLTEQWRKELDNRRIVGLVSMDLSKAFDILPHGLIVHKLAKYDADDSKVTLIKDYLTGRKQRVKLAGTFSPWLLVQRGIPQGSILGPLLLNIFMNDLPHVIDFTILATYADDTQFFYAGDNVTDVEQAINSDLGKIDKWYEENEMRRNHERYRGMIMGKTSRDPNFKCEGTTIPLVEEMKLLGVTVDNKLKFEGKIKNICRKVSQQIAVLEKDEETSSFKAAGESL
ncbi:putative RNA-directed DNA polymerase from transposon BS [Stylophora pistillata]|uniref:Putative RNA-directed DNA polymerase from transposon BS n=1 Tax=Stylophora pistillata TaxID=50429 RepID=A0A2B4RPN9_STYPI|nr:putative RNA-directed DNA polymerase from transposon BS [Stylophora pistillata]